jgi:hypothetical protein
MEGWTDGRIDGWKDRRMKGQTDRGKTVYLPPLLGSGGIIIIYKYCILIQK